MRAAAAIVLLAMVLSACSDGASTQDDHNEMANNKVTESSTISLPPTSGGFDYQLGGSYDFLDTGQAVDVVVRDAGSEPLPGAYNICYVNGFQTQPGSEEEWSKHQDTLLHDSAGRPITDPDWPDEFILDPSTQKQRQEILNVVGKTIDECADSGFDAVEIDNLDTSLRFDNIEESGAHELAKTYVERAHAAAMAIAQKNSAEIARAAHDELGFDFAVAEECGVWEECADYTGVYGDLVLQIEYPDALAEADMTFGEVCDRNDRAPLTILRDRELVAPGDNDYRYEAC